MAVAMLVFTILNTIILLAVFGRLGEVLVALRGQVPKRGRGQAPWGIFGEHVE